MWSVAHSDTPRYRVNTLSRCLFAWTNPLWYLHFPSKINGSSQPWNCHEWLHRPYAWTTYSYVCTEIMMRKAFRRGKLTSRLDCCRRPWHTHTLLAYSANCLARASTSTCNRCIIRVGFKEIIGVVEDPFKVASTIPSCAIVFATFKTCWTRLYQGIVVVRNESSICSKEGNMHWHCPSQDASSVDFVRRYCRCFALMERQKHVRELNMTRNIEPSSSRPEAHQDTLRLRLHHQSWDSVEL